MEKAKTENKHARTYTKLIRAEVVGKLDHSALDPKAVAHWRRAFDLVVEHVRDSTYVRRMFWKLVSIMESPDTMGQPYGAGSYGFDTGTRKVVVGKMRVIFLYRAGDLDFKHIDFHDEAYEQADKARGAK